MGGMKISFGFNDRGVVLMLGGFVYYGSFALDWMIDLGFPHCPFPEIDYTHFLFISIASPIARPYMRPM